MDRLGLLRALCLLTTPLILRAANIQPNLMSISITRHHQGDLFLSQGGTCYKDLCVGLSSGTAASVDAAGCGCQCMPNLPVFRDDLSICVDDIQECTLAQFVSGTTTQKIPFVFLPLKGQIVYPSAEITFSEVSSPICVVSGAQFLGRGGWLDLRNNSDTEPPFRLFRDEGRTYLQWLGEGELRAAMEGRLILVHLMCKDATESQQHRILTPCVAFRVAGNPSVREVIFSTDVRPTEEPSSGLSVSEYVAIGVCSVLLGLIYVASITLYMHIRKRRLKKQSDKDAESAHLNVEEGIVKNNPLLQPGRRHHKNNGGHDNDGFSSDSVSCCSDSDVPSDIEALNDDISHEQTKQNNLQVSAMVHPCELDRPHRDQMSQDSYERHPEEDVSIVEEMEGDEGEESAETINSMVGATIRKKLYFNPSYFDPEMLKTPPPAAIDFLTKIREVIAVAKHKMSAKRFSPSLVGIPEEDPYAKAERPVGMRSRANSVTSMASVRSSKEGKKNACPGCVDPPTPAPFHLVATGACCPTDTKQRIIRKWLEDVPIAKETPPTLKKAESIKSLKSSEAPRPEISNPIPLSQPIESSALIRNSEARSSTKSTTQTDINKMDIQKRPMPAPPIRHEIKRPSVKGPAPPRPPPPNPPKVAKPAEEVRNDIPAFSNLPLLISFKGRNIPDVPPPIPTSSPGPLPHAMNGSRSASPAPAPSPPPLPKSDPDSIPRVQGKDKVPPAIAKTLMDAVIKELVVQKKTDPKKQVIGGRIASEISTDHPGKEYEKDSLDRKHFDKIIKPEGFRLFERKEENDYDNQIDSCICPEDPPPPIPDLVQQHTTILQDDHDYEVILLSPEILPVEEEKELKIYNLPQILAKNEGYSLVSEVYVNDGYTYSSGECSPKSSTQSSKESLRSLNESPGRLTIQVKDSPDNYKQIPDESDFEPDTLDRKPGKLRIVDNITNWEDCLQEKYSNQKFHGMDMECEHLNQKNQYLSNDDFMDSLERPHIIAKDKFRKNSIEQHVDDLLRTLDSPLAKDFSSLREIYEAKNKANRKRTETTSLVGSVTSDTDCMSTSSWNEDRSKKLLHRGIILHMGSGKKQRKVKKQEAPNYPDVVPPRPPKPVSLSATPQRSGTNTPARSYCHSPANRSVCPSPSRSACTSPPPRSCMSPTRTCPTPPPPPRICSTPPPPPPPRSTPPASPVPRGPPLNLRSKPVSPVPPPPSQTSPPNRSRNGSGRTSPRTSVKSPAASPNRSACTSPIPPPPRSTCVSPMTPPRPGPKQDNIPPLPPRNLKPPLPPKNAKSTRQKKGGSSLNSTNLARRPLPPLPSRSYHDTLSSVGSASSRDLETLSTLSGASMDSLNSSDYEAFYTLPYDGNDGEIYDKAQEKFLRAQQEVLRNYKNFPLVNTSSDNVFSTDEDIYNAINMSSSFREKVKDLRTRGKRSSNSRWRPLGSFLHKPDDSGYLSTDSNESGLRSMVPSVARIPERAETPSQGSETEGSADGDGASESGAESTATDSFFFGKFRKEGDGFRHSFRLSDVEVNSDTERHNLPILVRH